MLEVKTMNMTTKTLIRNAFEELMEEQPYGRITVQNIVDRCGISRNTFYYHFKDIESLCESSVQGWIDRLDQEHTRLLSPLDCLAAIVEECESHRKILSNISRSVHRELFFRILEKSVVLLVNRYAAQTLPLEEESENDRKTILRFYKCCLMGLLIDWFEACMEYDLISFATRVQALLLNPESPQADHLRAAARRPESKK